MAYNALFYVCRLSVVLCHRRIFVSVFVLNRPNVVDTIFIVLHPERDDLFYSLSIILLLIS